MDHLTFLSIMEKVGPYGVPGIMAFLWWLSIKSLKEAYAIQGMSQDNASNRIMEQYQKVLEAYKGDFTLMGTQHLQILEKMNDKYDSNVRLVEMFGSLTQRYAERGEQLEKLIHINIQAMQQCIDTVDKCRKPREKS